VGAYATHHHHPDDGQPAAAVAVYLMPHHRGGVELRLTRAEALALAAEIAEAAALLAPEAAR